MDCLNVILIKLCLFNWRHIGNNNLPQGTEIEMHNNCQGGPGNCNCIIERTEKNKYLGLMVGI